MTASIDRLSDEYLERFQSVVNDDKNPVTYLGIDPGKTNGLCGYDAKFYPVFMMPVHADDMVKFLAVFDKVETCVMEGYKLYPNKANQQVYSSMETSRVIGRVESWAEHKSVKLIVQAASIKPTGYAWIGEKPLPKSNPRSHVMDGHVHFMYWGIKNGKIDARKLLKKPDHV